MSSPTTSPSDIESIYIESIANVPDIDVATHEETPVISLIDTIDTFIRSQWFIPTLQAVGEATQYARLWNQVQAGNHEEQPAPTLRQIIHPPRYPTPTMTPPHYLQPLIDDINLHADQVQHFMNLRALPQVSPPAALSRLPYPTDHPRPGWMLNYPRHI